MDNKTNGASARPAQKGKGAEVVLRRNEFYRDGFRTQTKINVISAATILGLTALVAVLALRKAEPVYFAADNGAIIKMTPLSEPHMATPTVKQWAVEGAIAAYSFDFVNYRQQFEASRRYFTADGFDSFMDALAKSGNLKAVTEKRMVVTAVATGAPVILKEGLLNGTYTWKLQVPLLVTFQSASEASKMDTIATIVVRRLPTLENPKGIGISQFVTG